MAWNREMIKLGFFILGFVIVFIGGMMLLEQYELKDTIDDEDEK